MRFELWTMYVDSTLLVSDRSSFFYDEVPLFLSNRKASGALAVVVNRAAGGSKDG